MIPNSVDRTIKDADSWDGSASRWDTAEDYCSCCLIDVNSAAGNDEKSKSFCKLPIRDPGDPSGTYNKKAVYAAAGGRGISSVSKPDGVSSEAWSSAVKKAANEIIKAYNQMDETAPDNVYEAAGKTPPKKDIIEKIKSALVNLFQRSVSVGDFYSQISSKLYTDDESTGSWSWLVDLYFEDNMNLFAVIAREGKLYKTAITFDGKDVKMGDFQEVQMEFSPVSQSMRISRQADGSTRVFLTAATSVLNRNGAIDSRALFDNMIKRAQDSGKYPFATYCHLGEAFKMGVYDFIARDGNVLLASFKMEDNEVSRAMLAAYEKSPDYWGSSISFYSLEEKFILVENSVKIPVYTDGEFYEISILPESIACSLFTSLVTAKEERSMDKRIKEALLTLAGGDEELLKDFESRVDGINREIVAESLVTRSSEDKTPETAPAPEVAPVTEPVVETPAATIPAPVQEVAVDDIVISRISMNIMQSPSFAKFMQDINEMVEQSRSTVASATAALNEVKALNSSLVSRIQKLEGSETEKQKRWQDDLPRNQSLNVTYRPRVSEPVASEKEESKVPLSQKAEDTLARIVK